MFKKMLAGFTAGMLGALSFAPVAMAYKMYQIEDASYNSEDHTLLLTEYEERNVEEWSYVRRGVVLDLHTCKGKSFDEIYYAPRDAEFWLWAVLIVLENVLYRELEGEPDLDWFYDPNGDFLGLVTNGQVQTAIAAYPNNTQVDKFTDVAREKGLCLGHMPGGVNLIQE